MNAFILYLLMLIASFFSAFVIGFNRYANYINSQKPAKNFKLLIISEILLHGLSGFFIGLILSIYTDNEIFIIVASGGGGMGGNKLFMTLFEGVLTGFIKLSGKKDDEDEQ